MAFQIIEYDADYGNVQFAGNKRGILATEDWWMMKPTNLSLNGEKNGVNN